MITPLRHGRWLTLDEVESTQEVARLALADGQDVGVVFAKHQTKGRGRFEREWFSEPGDSLTMSLIFADYPNHPKPWLIGMAVAAAAAAALHARLQWPNDLVLDGKKLGGILTQLLPDKQGRKVAVVGIGVNVNVTKFPPEIAEKATSLALHRTAKYDAESLAKEIVERIELLPEPDAWADLRPVWMMFDQTPRKQYMLSTGEQAVGLGIGSEGELICAVEGETRTVMAADALFGA